MVKNKDFQSKNGKGKKWAVTIVAAVLLSLLYIVIFSFSAQDGESSGSLSRVVTEKCVEIINHLTGGHWTEYMMEEFAAYFEHPVRKFAHFSEYACMGLLVYVMWCSWISRRGWLVAISAAWVFVSAAVDEFHQLFVPGRYGSFADVCLDTLGGLCGALVCVLAVEMLRRRQARKQETI